MNVIGVSGKARSGKDTLFSIAEADGYVRLSFAEELKRRAREDFGISKEHTDGSLKEAPCAKLNGHSPREFLIELGNLYRRYRPSFWLDVVINKIKENPRAKYMVTDVRYQNEADALKEVGAILIRLERHPDRDTMVDENTKKSISETALDTYDKFDYLLPGNCNKVPSDLQTAWNSVKVIQAVKREIAHD